MNIRLKDSTNNAKIIKFLEFGEMHDNQLSELAKLMIAQRFGGTFLDSNVVVINKFIKIDDNWFLLEPLKEVLIPGGIFHINNYGIGRELSHEKIS